MHCMLTLSKSYAVKTNTAPMQPAKIREKQELNIGNWELAPAAVSMFNPFRVEKLVITGSPGLHPGLQILKPFGLSAEADKSIQRIMYRV